MEMIQQERKWVSAILWESPRHRPEKWPQINRSEYLPGVCREHSMEQKTWKMKDAKINILRRFELLVPSQKIILLLGTHLIKTVFPWVFSSKLRLCSSSTFDSPVTNSSTERPITDANNKACLMVELEWSMWMWSIDAEYQMKKAKQIITSQWKKNNGGAQRLEKGKSRDFWLLQHAKDFIN